MGRTIGVSVSLPTLKCILNSDCFLPTRAIRFLLSRGRKAATLESSERLSQHHNTQTPSVKVTRIFVFIRVWEEYQHNWPTSTSADSLCRGRVGEGAFPLQRASYLLVWAFPLQRTISSCEHCPYKGFISPSVVCVAVCAWSAGDIMAGTVSIEQKLSLPLLLIWTVLFVVSLVEPHWFSGADLTHASIYAGLWKVCKSGSAADVCSSYNGTPGVWKKIRHFLLRVVDIDVVVVV